MKSIRQGNHSKPYNLLLAIDGTDSYEWCDASGENSHVRRFFHSFPGSISITKQYISGPEVYGSEVPLIAEMGLKWILNALKPFLQKGIPIEEIGINLVGFSRGAVIAIMVANKLENLAAYAMRDLANASEAFKRIGHLPKLRLEVEFMGLYDAVDRAVAITSLDLRLRNVKFLSHATRSSSRLSRPSFGVITIPEEAGRIRNSKSFDTSHGGVGGDPGFFTQPIIKKDLYCNALSLLVDSKTSGVSDKLKRIISGSLGDRTYSWFWQSLGGQQSKSQRIKQVRRYWLQSREADIFIRENAKAANLQLKSFMHTPWHTNDDILGKELSIIVNLNKSIT